MRSNYKLTHSRGAELLKAHQTRGRSKELIYRRTLRKQRLERQKGRQQAGDKPLPEIELVAVHKTHLLIP
jgi:hypothetical protein